MSRRAKLLIFHPALAPYRIDFFNLLADMFDAHLVLLGTNLEEQKFDQKRLLAKLKCRVSYLTKGFMLFGRYIRTGFISIVKKERPDIVLGYEYSPLTVLILLYKLVCRCRFRFYTMTDDNKEMFIVTRGIRKILRGFVLRHADGVIVTNRETAELAEKHHVRTAVVPIVYEANTFRSDGEKVFAAAERLRRDIAGDAGRIVLYVGRLAKVKNLKWASNHILEVLPPSAKFVIVGSGPEEVSLRKLVDKTPGAVERIVFAGRHEGEALMPYFAAADLFLLPSFFEPYGAVVAEALMWGTPCLVSSHVGAKELVDAGNGDIFEIESPGDFESRLQNQMGRLPKWIPGRDSLLKVDFTALKRDLETLLQERA